MKFSVKRSLALAAAAVLLLTALVSCSPRMTDDEARAAFGPLVERSLSLNEIIFGDGLPVETAEFTIGKFLEATSQTRETAAYLPVAADAPIQSEAALRAAIMAVYSEDYGGYLCRLLFDGVSDGDDDETALGLANVIFARYRSFTDVYRKEDSVLCVRVEIDEDKIDLAAVTYDYGTMTVDRTGTEGGKDWVHVTVSAAASAGAEMTEPVTETIEVGLRFVREGDAWRLDSPTFVSADVFDVPLD